MHACANVFFCCPCGMILREFRRLRIFSMCNLLIYSLTTHSHITHRPSVRSSIPLNLVHPFLIFLSLSFFLFQSLSSRRLLFFILFYTEHFSTFSFHFLYHIFPDFRKLPLFINQGPPTLTLTTLY